MFGVSLLGNTVEFGRCIYSMWTVTEGSECSNGRWLLSLNVLGIFFTEMQTSAFMKSTACVTELAGNILLQRTKQLTVDCWEFDDCSYFHFLFNSLVLY